MPKAPDVLIPLVDGFEEVEAVAVIDVLRRAGARVVTAAVDNRRVVGSHDIPLHADALLADVLDREWDAIVLPGGPGTAKLNDAAGLHERLRRQAASGKLVGAICAAPTVLAEAGLLEGVEAACFPASRGAMRGAVVLDQAVVDAFPIITAQAMGSAVDFGLRLAARLCGEDIAVNLARAICHPPSSVLRPR